MHTRDAVLNDHNPDTYRYGDSMPRTAQMHTTPLASAVTTTGKLSRLHTAVISAFPIQHSLCCEGRRGKHTHTATGTTEQANKRPQSAPTTHLRCDPRTRP